MRFLLLTFLLFSWAPCAQLPQVLLLNTYKDQNISGWVMSEKLDGIRAYWNGKQLLSRRGNIIEAPEWFLRSYPPFAVDGELWSKRGEFEKISSIVRDKTPGDEWREIAHYIFDVPNAKGDLTERLNSLKPYENNHIKLLIQYPITHKNDLSNFLQKIETLGGEGVVVRDPTAPYIASRTSKALKVKSFLDDECMVVGYTKGRGKYLGKVGALECKLLNGVRFKLGSGLSDRERVTPPQIGDVVTFKYKELTKYKKPRFPTFVRLRYTNNSLPSVWKEVQ